MDFAVPTSLQLSISLFYGVVIALCAWTTSRKFLSCTTAAVTVSLFGAGLLHSISRHPPDVMLTLFNRSLRATLLLVIARIVDRWMIDMKSLDAQRALTRRLLNGLDVAQFIIRKVDGEILYWSRGAQKLYGWTAEDAVGKKTHDLLQTHFGSESIENIKEHLDSKDSWTGELCHTRKDGSSIWVACQWTVQVDGFYEFPVVTEVNNDITGLKAAETRFRNLTEVIPHLIWQVSPTGQITYANHGWQEYFGREPEEVVVSPSDMAKFIHPDDSSKLVARWQKAFRTGIMEPWEIRYRRHDGIYRWFSGRAVAVRDDREQILYWIGTATDIDDEKSIQDRLRETQKIESIGRLAGGVAHDFNNLLTAISGFSDFASDEIADTSPVASRYLSEVKKATGRAAALTRQLLSFSRPQLGKAKIVNMNSIVKDISKILSRLIGEDVHLATRLSPDLPNVLADPVQIDQIIMNLSVNARDAMPTGGTIQLTTGEVAVEEFEAKKYQVSPGRFVMLSVRDTGTGMDEATKAHLFEPFFSTKEHGKGTGLGLSIVWGIVKHSGGFIKVDSAIGTGTQFTILLPSSTESESANEADQTGKAILVHGETILLVEDEDTIRDLVRDTLARRGYTVLEAATPSAAVRLFREHASQVHLLVSDVLMPEMRGPQLVSTVRQVRPDLPVLYMSGYSDSTFLDPAILRDAFFIQKPFRPEELANKVAEVLERTSTGPVS